MFAVLAVLSINSAIAQEGNFAGIARSSAIGFSIGNKGYIGTGMGSGSGNKYAIKDLWEYDPNLK